MPFVDLMARRGALTLVCLAGVLCMPARAAAQTLFAWPDTAVDVATYQTIEECEAVVARSFVFLASHDSLTAGVWQDTVPVDSAHRAGAPPLPEPVSATARRCGARFATPDSISRFTFTELLPLYLQAGWDDRAHTLIERRLAAIAPGHDAERAAVLDTVFAFLLARTPEPIGLRRVALVDTLTATQIPRIADRVKRLHVYLILVLAGTTDEMGLDSAAARAARLALKMQPIVDSLTPRERDQLQSQFGPFGAGLDSPDGFAQRYAALLNLALGRRALLDSLRRSTAAYVKLLEGNWTKATGMRHQPGNPVGEVAPPIQATIWRGYDPAKGSRPTRGRVSLVVFLNRDDCYQNVPTGPSELRDDCARRVVALRRLEQRFPDLETTVVTHSSGYYLYLKDGITPEREADLTKHWLASYGVRAAVALAVPEAWRYPAPDARRIARPTSVETAYAFGKTKPVANGDGYLIDQDGIVIHAEGADRLSVDQDYSDMIQILLDRQRYGAR
jgi:hypothetical protein